MEVAASHGSQPGDFERTFVRSRQASQVSADFGPEGNLTADVIDARGALSRLRLSRVYRPHLGNREGGTAAALGLPPPGETKKACDRWRAGRPEAI